MVRLFSSDVVNLEANRVDCILNEAQHFLQCIMLNNVQCSKQKHTYLRNSLDPCWYMSRKVSTVPLIPDDVCRQIISKIPFLSQVKLMAPTDRPDVVKDGFREAISMMREVILKVDPVIVIVTLILVV